MAPPLAEAGADMMVLPLAEAGTMQVRPSVVLALLSPRLLAAALRHLLPIVNGSLGP